MELQELAVIFLLIICINIKICKLQGLVVVSETTDLTIKDDNKHSDEEDKIVPVMHFKDVLKYYENYSIHEIAKEVSHSKGIFIDKNPNEPNSGVQLRRSITRKLAISSNSDLVEELMHSLKGGSGNKFSILKQIEYLVHEYDVAVYFAKIGGIELILPYLLSSQDELVSAAALLLGTAMQSNPEVQKQALNQKVLQTLLKLLMSKKNVNFSRILFALSACLRNMPEAQKIFHQNNGIFILTALLSNSTIAIKAKMKIVDLLHDLSTEHKVSETDVPSEDFQKLQDLKVILEAQVKKSKVCAEIPRLLKINKYTVHQKVIAAMRAATPFCHQVFKNSQLLQYINMLLSYYTVEDVELLNSERDGAVPIDDDLKQSMSEEIRLLLNNISAFAKTEMSKDEL